MSQQLNIRDMHQSGKSISAIAKELHMDRKTVRKYLNADDFSPEPPTTRQGKSRLDPYREVIDGWLDADRCVFYKQRHTAKRVFERLKDECGYEGGYTTVQRYVKERRGHQGKALEPLDLVWSPGTCQADFGQADFLYQRAMARLHYFTTGFPHSNMGLTQVFRGECSECVCQGLSDIFHYVGGVPPLAVFDNGTGIGRRIKQDVFETELFARFRAHFGFKIRLCSPYSGWEKGVAERKVAFHRKSLFVPVVAVDDLVAYNKGLLERCMALEDRAHYRKQRPIMELFEDDRRAFLPLPSKPFDVVRYEYVKADGYGYATLDGCHVYSSSPSLARAELVVAVRAHTIDVAERDGTVVSTHPRAFGKGRTESIDATSTVRHLAKKPGAWLNSPLRAQMPEAVAARMDALSADGLKRDLGLLADSFARSGVDATMDALDVLASDHGVFPDFFTVGVLAARIAGFGLEVPPVAGAELGIYDDEFLGTAKGGECDE